MNNKTDNFLNYLVQNRIIDNSSSDQILKELKVSKKLLGSILVQSGFFTKEDLLMLIIEFYKNGYIKLGEINDNFAVDIVFFLKELAKNLKLKFIDLDSVDIDYKMLAKLPFSKVI